MYRPYSIKILNIVIVMELELAQNYFFHISKLNYDII